MRFDFEPQICVFRTQKRMTLFVQSKYAKSDQIFFRFENPMTQVVGFWHKNGMLSKFKMLSMTANSSSRTIDELDSDTAV